MPPRPLSQDTLRAARLSFVPGVTIAEAAQRFGVPRAQVERARRERKAEVQPSLAELALAALSQNGERAEGELGDLGRIASWIDYLNHDGCTAQEARRLLDGLVAQGQLAIEGGRWRLLRPWP